MAFDLVRQLLSLSSENFDWFMLRKQTGSVQMHTACDLA